SIEPPEKCAVCGKCQPKQSEDVFDTWFSSALWPFATLGWPKKTKDLEQFYPTDIICTARDIINLWVVRMIFSSLELLKKIPFKEIIIHATILAKDGRRMSKSLGTGINPMDLIERYGADATRFGLAWQITELQDIRFGEENMVAGKKFCNKIWNASRFVMQQVGGDKLKTGERPKALTEEDKKVLNSLDRVVKKVDKDLAKFCFGSAIQEVYHFFWHEFCDIYIEKSKEQIRDEKTAANTKKLLIYVLANSLKVLHPFMPFITEEIYQYLPLENKKALIIEDWPKS
ncbi:MAG: class I tRNA ligase family protein, partial [bacterium]